MSHAKARAKERYGVVLSDADMQALVAQILTKKSMLTKRLLDAEIHAVLFKDKAMIAVYSPQHRSIVTFLPLDKVKSKSGQVRFSTHEKALSTFSAKHINGVQSRKALNKHRSKSNRREKSVRFNNEPIDYE